VHDEENPQPPSVRIVHHADGTAEVDGVPVAIEPGQDPRDAAYLAAVQLIAGAAVPVAATRVEADGTEYPLMLYPVPGVLATGAVAAGAAGVMGIGGVGGAAVGVGERLRRRSWRRPTLGVGWLVAAACACVLLSVLATLLLQKSGPPVVRLSVDTESATAHAPVAMAIGTAMRVHPQRDASGAKAATLKPKPSTPTPSPIARAGAKNSAGGAAGVSSGTSQGSGMGAPAPAPGPRPRPRPGGGGQGMVSDVTLTLIGGGKIIPGVSYVITVSTASTAPVTLTYTYSSGSGSAPVAKSEVLSGQTEYAIVGLIPAQPNCGGTVTMTAATYPTAGNGTAYATSHPSC